MFNRVVAICILLTISPVLAVIAIVILILMGKPVLFTQERSGLHGEPFKIIKFRSMRNASGGEEGDRHRITRLGSFLRSTSLDEVPSLWNIVRGQMVFVGPRPFIAEYAEHFTPRQSLRLSVKPGLTGWMQINGRNALTWNEKIDLDIWYVENKSLGLDLRILLKTPLAVLAVRGISHPGDATMPKFKPNE